MTDLKIRVLNNSHAIAVARRLYELGYEFPSGEPIEVVLLNCTQGYLVTSDWQLLYGFGLDNFERAKAIEIKFDDLYTGNYSFKKPIRVKLNNDYDAIVGKGEVVVGCQKFSFQAAKDLYDAVKLYEEQ